MAKRDDEFLRDMLIGFEDSDDYAFVIGGYMRMPADERKQEYHVHLACDAGLMIEIGREVFRLSNSGHDYIQATRDEGIWQSTKNAVAETGGSATLEIVKSLATGFLKQKIAQHTGVEIQ
ncbi:MAG: DUF2513 domain-containing protein [Roseicyclus sp.]|nr:DUF2513 domain-containing protein [Roseicyclus sp.]